MQLSIFSVSSVLYRPSLPLVYDAVVDESFHLSRVIKCTMMGSRERDIALFYYEGSRMWQCGGQL